MKKSLKGKSSAIGCEGVPNYGIGGQTTIKHAILLLTLQSRVNHHAASYSSFGDGHTLAHPPV